ncbi:MAG TPA: proline--tRNA ligase [Woeseiaceae bacterium]|nr:proline--tRNA ligase [Woeseiaceae bacterium]|tara:strand:+ start:17943 stop:19640 length:1698 start_codon:yes stop_codon:yes gene_type:complete
MLYSKLCLTTIKENPAEAEIVSHQLMLRAGLIRKLSSGLFTWLPIGLRVLRKVETIVREEMNKAGAQEILMPAVQPSELWKESGRWDEYGSLLLRMQDRHERDYCFGPTHEEVVTDIARKELRSHKQLPVNFYQIQTKFRDEIRPRFGIMRAREFLMKDAYSFHLNQDSLEEGYKLMHTAYSSAFSRLGLEFRVVDADSGEIGGNRSQEFHVIADSGEDAIVYCDEENYASNIELAIIKKPQDKRPTPKKQKEKVSTPNTKDIRSLCGFLKIKPQETIKTLIVNGADNPIAIVIRGDHELNIIKASKIPGVSLPITMTSKEDIKISTGYELGFLGPIELGIPTYYDHAVTGMSDFVCGANERDYHYTGVNFGNDIDEPETHDLRNVVDGDPSPSGKGMLKIARGIEVGHIFQLGTKYSEALNATIQDQKGNDIPMSMGCYGIGITRIVGAAVEQNHDTKGIIWPETISPFHVIIIPINLYKSNKVKKATEDLYSLMQKRNIEVLLDNRNVRPGVQFADAELIGIPHRVVISDKGIDSNQIEYRHRTSEDSKIISTEQLFDLLENE